MDSWTLRGIGTASSLPHRPSPSGFFWQGLAAGGLAGGASLRRYYSCLRPRCHTVEERSREFLACRSRGAENLCCARPPPARHAASALVIDGLDAQGLYGRRLNVWFSLSSNYPFRGTARAFAHKPALPPVSMTRSKPRALRSQAAAMTTNRSSSVRRSKHHPVSSALGTASAGEDTTNPGVPGVVSKLGKFPCYCCTTT